MSVIFSEHWEVDTKRCRLRMSIPTLDNNIWSHTHDQVLINLFTFVK
jgi:hypothetical protein